MTTYNYAQLEGLWINAGGSTSLAPLMAAIALAESSGNSSAYNPVECSSGSHAEGLWQICMPLNSQYVPGGNANDPASNAAAAVAIYKAQGLGAWATYTSGAYKQFMQGSTTPDTNVPSSSGIPGAPGYNSTTTTGLIGAAGCLINLSLIGCILTKSEARAIIGGLLLAAGGLIFAAGLAVVVAGSIEGPAGRAASQALTNTPAGRILTPTRRDTGIGKLEPAKAP